MEQARGMADWVGVDMSESTFLRACDAARASGINVNTIRCWTLRGQLAARSYDHKMRPLYSVDDVLDVACSFVAKEAEQHAARARRRAERATRKRKPYIRQPSPRLPMVGYNSVHQRLKRDRGPASAYDCANCDAAGMDWAYDHADADELLGTDGPYSLDPAHYRPLCRHCHKTLDMARRSEC
jgi:hypothetical protein